MAETRSSRLARYAAWGLLALGVVLRLRQYLINRSLWLDEAMLALNILHKDWGGLFGKLDYDQGAPLGFLLLEKLAANLLGSGERALRLLPLLAGCAALALFYLLARQLFTPTGTLTALALFALSPTLVYYSSEVKQYSSDVFIALLLLSLAWRSTKPGDLVLLVTGALALWFSHPALFVLAGLGVVKLIQNRQKPLGTLGLGAVWLISLGLLYAVNLRQLSQNEFLLNYWQEYFAAGPLQMALGLFANPAGLEAYAPVLLAVTLIGVFLLFKRQPALTGSLLLVFVFALVASGLRVYPFAGRMLLFSTPFIYLFLATAVDWLWNLRLRVFSPLMALALAGFLLYSPALASAERFFAPKYPEHLRPTLAYLEANRKPGDFLYVYYWALPAYRYYADPSAEYVAGGPQTLLADLAQFQGRGRVWVLFSHVYETEEYNEKDLALEQLNQWGEKKRQLVEPGTSVYLYLYDFAVK